MHLLIFGAVAVGLPLVLAASGRFVLALVPPVLLTIPLLVAYAKGPSVEEVKSAEINAHWNLAFVFAVIALGAVGWVAGFAVCDLRRSGFFARRRKPGGPGDT